MNLSRDRTSRGAIYAVVLLLPLVFQALGFWRSAMGMASNPYQMDYGEGVVLYQASRITEREVAYKPITSYPFVVFHYPPVYHWVVRALSSITGDLLLAGRAVSVIAGALTSVTIGLLVYLSVPGRDRWRRVTSALFAGLLPSVLVVMLWTGLARVDMLAVLLSFAGLAVFILAGRRRRWCQYLAFTCFVAAVFTKQTAVAAPAACLVTAWLINRKQAGRLLAFACALGGLLLFGLSWWTRGGVLHHLFLYNQNTFSVERMLQGMVQNVVLVSPVAVFAALSVGLLVADVSSLGRDRRWRKIRSWLVRSPLRRLATVASVMVTVAWLVALTYGKTGSNFNYFIDWNLACCVLAGLALFRCWTQRWCLVAAALVAWVLPIAIFVAEVPSGLRAFWPANAAVRAHGAEQSAAHSTLLDLVRSTDGPVLSENMLVLLQAGKEVPAEPAILRELATSGTWDERALTERIFNRQFDLIITVDLSNPAMYTPAVARAIEKTYVQTRQIAQYEVYEPRQGP